jgi:hypothetical protein
MNNLGEVIETAQSSYLEVFVVYCLCLCFLCSFVDLGSWICLCKGNHQRCFVCHRSQVSLSLSSHSQVLFWAAQS